MSNPTKVQMVDAVRKYINTPFRHMGRIPGVCLDCVGVVVCGLRDIGAVEADWDVPAYLPTPDGDNMKLQCAGYMTPVPFEQAVPGDIILLATQLDPQHLGVLGNYLYGGFSIIHAANNANPARVIETRLMFRRNCVLVGTYQIKGLV